MKLDWKFDIPNNLLTCVVDNIVYTAHRGAKSGVTKSQAGNEILISYDDWPNELQWISDNYSDLVGKLIIPPILTDEEAEDYMQVTGCPVYPSWGFKTPYTETDFEHYDRLCRPNWLMSNKFNIVMHSLYFDGTTHYETDGNKIYKRSMNLMPCCVFPDNPGWQLSNEDELREAGFIGDLELLPPQQPDLLEKHFVLP